MKIKHLILALIVATFSLTMAQDAEIHKEIKASEQRYKGVFPPEVKTIAMIAPASYPGSRSHRRGVELIQAAGYKVKVGKHAFDKPPKGEHSAPLEARLEDFYNAWNDDEVDMILCIRGGRGSLDLLEHLDFSKLKPRENLRLQGYSDITFILSAMQGKKFGHPIAGPMSGSISGLQPECIEEMKKMHHGLAIGPIPVKPIIPGDCSGLPLAGLLQRFSVVCKTQFKPETKGRIIIIEAVNIKVEQVKQSFDTLIAEGFFKDCAGVVFGHFIRSGSPEEISTILDDVAKRINKPTYKGFPFGHSSNCYTIDFSRQFVIKDNQVTIPGK
ncbi:MAG: LD-carboxypeptidase [Victivallales bacterium]|nr:LD-carboxypeptidase [Victivallales bacterium]